MKYPVIGMLENNPIELFPPKGRPLGTWTGAVSEALTSITDRFIASVLLLLTSPIIATVYVLHRLLVNDGGPFLYRGERVGKNGARFTIYKIRTLRVDAEKELHGALYDSERKMETVIGPFLRETRLDELPQMLNVIKGDMLLVGPRPERPSVYETLCKDIPGYHQRFMVLPGVTGLSQFLTPHGTSKRIRARIDILLARKMKNPLWRIYLIAWTGIAIARTLLAKLWKLLSKQWISHNKQIHLRNIELEIAPPARPCESQAKTILSPLEITAKTMRVVADRPLEKRENIHIIVRRRIGNRLKKARCQVSVINDCQSHVIHQPEGHPPRSSRHAYIIEYKATSHLQSYFLERYVLRKIVA